ncbi:hypothetical protein CsSME_00004612 [Camellia sinensis var. sinensis]
MSLYGHMQRSLGLLRHQKKKLHQITNGTASGSSGFVNITDLKGGKVGFEAQDNGGNVDAVFIKSSGEVPYNMSVIQISKILPSVQAEAPTLGPSQMNLTALMSAHGCKVFTKILQTSDAEKTFKDNLDDGLIVFCPGDDAFKNYLPKYKILASGYVHCRNNVAGMGIEATKSTGHG